MRLEEFYFSNRFLLFYVYILKYKYTLAVFSVIEAFLRHKLGFAVDYKTTFYQLLQTYREKFGRGDHFELLYVFIPQNCNSQPVDDLRKILKEH